MRLKRFGIVTLTLACVCVPLVSAASAADPLFLFGGQTGTISEGKATFSTASQFSSTSCERANPTNSKIEATNDVDTFKGKIEFEGCTDTGLGLASGHLAVEIRGLLCLVSATESRLEPCAYMEFSNTVHLEVPLIGLSEFLAGSSDACTITPDGTSTKTLTMTCKKEGNGVLLIKEVKDLGKVLKTGITLVENHTGSTTAAIEATFKITFANAGTLDG